MSTVNIVAAQLGTGRGAILHPNRPPEEITVTPGLAVMGRTKMSST